MRTLIQNVRVVSPGMDLNRASVLVENGLIQAVIRLGQMVPAAEKVIDGRGQILMPGFVDIHTHGASGADVCDGTADSIRTIAETKLKEGVTTFLPTTITAPNEVLEKSMEAVKAYAQDAEFAKTPGVHIEGPFINRKCAGAQNPDFVRKSDWSELKALHDIYPVSVVSVAIETEGALPFTKSATDAGITVSAAHTDASYMDFLQAKKKGMTHLTHFCNQMTPLHHREIGLVGAGLLDDDVKLELICDGVHLNRDMIKLIFKSRKMEDLMLITDSVAASWCEDGVRSFGGLKVEVKDGVARLENGSLAGSTLRFNEGLKMVRSVTGLSLAELVKTTSWNQAQSLGLEGIGKIENGYAADFVLLDEEMNVMSTFVNGVQKYKKASAAKELQAMA
ncbi:N-acetylglucosamine-6-phosphate deacetylase [Persicobacter sp. CCB-QB2]|uniref:N-acetylglucosamine-6-phosphate deacetylase n=1 Tax=Persicobacter sp. CCB-QB2 TaxID=1561025 RepID=UPI0006A9AF4D|nr:N-acetylglucosamine-6-phosphate deacetylase [Persicobacter sp. CCB-QB2]